MLIQWLLWLKINNIITYKIIEKAKKKKPEIAKDFVIPASLLSQIIKNKDVILKIFNIKLLINKFNLKLYLNSAT